MTVKTTDPWVERWFVPRSKGDGNTIKTWVVSRKQSGLWGCSCPVWKFPKERDYAGNTIRKECHHIRQVRGRTDDVTSAEVMARIANLDPQETYEILREAYIKAGYMPIGSVNDPPEDWQKQRLDELKHDTRKSLVCLKTGGASPNDCEIELMVKDL